MFGTCGFQTLFYLCPDVLIIRGEVQQFQVGISFLISLFFFYCISAWDEIECCDSPLCFDIPRLVFLTGDSIESIQDQLHTSCNIVIQSRTMTQYRSKGPVSEGPEQPQKYEMQCQLCFYDSGVKQIKTENIIKT